MKQLGWTPGLRVGLLAGSGFAALMLALEVSHYALPAVTRYVLGMLLLVGGGFGAGYLTAAHINRHTGGELTKPTANRMAAWGALEGAKAGALLIAIPVIVLLSAERWAGVTTLEREPSDRPLPQEVVPAHPEPGMWKSSAYVAIVLVGAACGAVLGTLGAAQRIGTDYERQYRREQHHKHRDT